MGGMSHQFKMKTIEQESDLHIKKLKSMLKLTNWEYCFDICIFEQTNIMIQSSSSGPYTPMFDDNVNSKIL